MESSSDAPTSTSIPLPSAVRKHKGAPAPQSGIEGAPLASEATSAIRTSAGAPQVRARGRWFVEGLGANANKVTWLELPTKSEGTRDADVARWQWVWMPASGGAPQIGAANLIAGGTSFFGTDETHVYLWLHAPVKALHAMPLEGGPMRALAPSPHSLNVSAASGTVCFVANTLGENGLSCVPRDQSNPIRIAPVAGGAHPLVLGDHVYWYGSVATRTDRAGWADRCIYRARVDRADAEPEQVSCSRLLMGPIASDGARLFVLGGDLASEGERSFVFTLEPSTSTWTQLRELAGGANHIAAQAGHVAVSTTSMKDGNAITVLDTTGRACLIAQNLRDVKQLALGVGRVFWTAESGVGDDTLGMADVVERSFKMDPTHGACAAAASPSSK